MLFDFDAADTPDPEVLGGKGAGLARMTALGLPVPPGFTITTAVARHLMAHNSLPDGLWAQVEEAVARLETRTSRTYGGGPVPLLLSVRSGAAISMPGMMDTVLNIGINDDVVKALAAWSQDEHFAWDAYRRFLQMYGDVVLGIDDEHFQTILSGLRSERGVDNDADLTATDLKLATENFKALIDGERPGQLPYDPMDQLRGAISAVFESWGNERAISYRRIHGIPDEMGTACNVQMMVFGDLGEDSGTGVCFTRDPGTGEAGRYGDYLPRAQGEDVVAGVRNTLNLDELAQLQPNCHGQLVEIMDRLEQAYRDMCDIEFTIEKGVLYILQARVGKRTAAAAVRLAVAMASEGLLDRETALLRVDPTTLEQIHRPRIGDQRGEPFARGVAASPGAAIGVACFSAEEAVEMAAAGKSVILIRPETTPDDINGMAAAEAILTSHGGKTSHAAVVARGMGKPALTGAFGLLVDTVNKVATAGDTDIRSGEVITVDGTNGVAYAGAMELVPPAPLPELEELLEWADRERTLRVRANADTAEDAAAARRLGAEGIGLARTEHMFMGQRLEIVRRIILSSDEEEKEAALGALERLQIDDFTGILEAMDGLPVVVRLLDPPLHEFLPNRLELEQEAVRMVRAGRSITALHDMSEQVARWEETNPMLGLRGVRLGLIVPRLYRMQARAAGQALVARLEAGGDPHLEIMIPLVATAEELRRMRAMVQEEIHSVASRAGFEAGVAVGTMIELPRAALTAAEIAAHADFFSFGTNDLTQMTYGLSRDDAEAHFLRDYLEGGILAGDPFQSIDVDGVGRLVEVASREGRQSNPGLTLGICGEHGGDPASIAFVHSVGLDYVSCSTPRIEGARLAAAQAAITQR